jgi:hypothetical protein
MNKPIITPQQFNHLHDQFQDMVNRLFSSEFQNSPPIESATQAFMDNNFKLLEEPNLPTTWADCITHIQTTWKTCTLLDPCLGSLVPLPPSFNNHLTNPILVFKTETCHIMIGWDYKDNSAVVKSWIPSCAQ